MSFTLARKRWRELRLLLALILTCGAASSVEIRGSVVHAMERRALKRAEVVLRPAAGGRARGTTTDDSGRFSFHEVPPGFYRIEVSRVGFMPSTVAWHNNSRLSDPVNFENDIEGLTIKLVPSAVISGKVRHSDGDPAPRLAVQAWREYWVRNRHVFEAVRSEVTDDRGEYRLSGLPPGRYYIAAVAVPFRGNDDIDEQWVRDASGVLMPPERPVTTFLPSSWKLSDASPIQVFAGAEIGNADIFLARARIGTITGRVTHGANGQPIEGATIRLMREDGSGTGFLPANHFPVRSHGRGEFTIMGVLPGSYVLEARSSEKGGILYSRQVLNTGNAPVTTLNILLQPEIAVAGQAFNADKDTRLPPGLRIVAEPRSDGVQTRSARVEGNGTFALRLMAGERYDLVLQHSNDNTYLRSATMNSEDVLRSGFRLDSSTPVPLTLTLDALGADVRGQTQPGATVSLIPSNGLLSRFQETVSNEWGVFQFKGVAPGQYRVLAWFDEPPCDLWNQIARTECNRFGQTLDVQEAGSHTVTLQP